MLSNMNSQRLTKMQLHYWEAKQTFLKKIKKEQDDCVVACDAGLDSKLELLKSIDETNQNLLVQIDAYQERTLTLAQEECIIGRFLRECSRLDPTRAGKLMSGSGKTLLFSSHQTIALRVVLLRLYRDLQTFQYRAVADTFDTIERMEKARTAYRAALLWMKDLSKELDPDAYGRMDKFKRVQEHVRNTRTSFEKLKYDSIQKIDLLSASRTNLFSNLFTSYQNSLVALFSKSSKTMNVFVETFKTSEAAGFDFQVLKELNDVHNVEEQVANFEARLKEILAQDNINEKDMLLFFETDYVDDDKVKSQESLSSKNNKSQRINKKTSKSKKTEKKLRDNIESLLDLTQSTLEEKKSLEESEKQKSNLDLLTESGGNFLPSSLIDLQTSDTPKDFDYFDQLMSNLPSYSTSSHPSTSRPSDMKTSPDENTEATKAATSSSKPENKNLDWLSFFSDIDPLASAQDFDKLSGDKKTAELF